MAAQDKRALKRRVNAIKNTQKITRAMKLVAAAKLRRAQERVTAARPYAREMARVLSSIASVEGAPRHPLLTPRTVYNVAYVVLTADRGLCGPYNMNVIRKAAASMAEARTPVSFIAVGRKGRDYFRRRGRAPVKQFIALGEEARLDVARRIVSELVDMYTRGEVDEVRLVYTEFVSAISQRVTETVLLPVQPPPVEPARGVEMEYIFEPEPEKLISLLAPRYVETLFFQAMLESKASEHGARMTAMGNATDNAGELLDKLTIAMNRARQAGITRELADIVGGAEALKG